MSDISHTIHGELLRLKRESRGWLVSDMATRACMSVKQIRQLEEGGTSSFYSESVKLTSAKKVGAILGLTPEEVFGVTATDPVSGDADVAVDAHENGAPQVHAKDDHDAVVSETEAVAQPLVTPTAVVEPAVSAPGSADPSSEQKNKTPLGAIAALFIAALAVAAWMRPEAEPVAVEPPPPLQTLPAETPDATASAASSAEAAAPVVMASSPASAASAVVRPASAATTGSSPARPAAPAGSAPVSPPPTGTSAPASKPL